MQNCIPSHVARSCVSTVGVLYVCCSGSSKHTALQRHGDTFDVGLLLLLSSGQRLCVGTR